jgi:flagellar M-ring protein FliF
VTRGAPGQVKRLSVAVLLREPDKGRRSANEIGQINDLVKSAVGFDQSRNDNVTVISRKFATSGEGVTAAKWYDNAWVPVLARNGTAILIALLVLFLGVRPIAKGLMKKRDDAAPALVGSRPIDAAAAGQGAEAGQPITLDQLETTRGYDNRISAVRGFTRDNPARAALAVRDMIKA